MSSGGWLDYSAFLPGAHINVSWITVTPAPNNAVGNTGGAAQTTPTFVSVSDVSATLANTGQSNANAADDRPER